MSIDGCDGYFPFCWYSTTDGITWTLDSPGHANAQVIFCSASNTFTTSGAANCSSPEGRGKSAAFGAGVWVITLNGKISRSENNGTSWTAVTQAGSDLEGVAFGCVK